MKLGKASSKWAFAHIEHFGDTDIFPVPFEYAAIRADWGALLPELLETELERYPSRELRRTLTPKSRYGFRLVTQLDPIDALLFTATVCEVARDLERQALNPLLNELEDLDYLERQPGARDRRHRVLELTPRGLAFAAEITSVLEGMEDEIVQRIGRRRFEQTRRAIIEITELFATTPEGASMVARRR